MARSTYIWSLSTGLAVLLGACFDGGFARGLACERDADCGPMLACVEGLCGGPGGASLCGNGLVDAGEGCDDGNTAAGDACTPDCRLPVCGDGFLAAGESCDDGNAEDGDGCPASCSVCGDGVTDATEACDDGNTADGDACTPACRFPACGDGFLAAGEVCDDGDDDWTDECTPECALPACGDGVVQGDEVCDDADADEFDDCTTACSGSPQTPTLRLSLAQVKQFGFTWEPSLGAEYYQLLESVDAGAEYVQIGGDIHDVSLALTVPLLWRTRASYRLRACRDQRCAESETVSVAGDLAPAVGYFKASNTGSADLFGASLALSGDGRTLAVAAPGEASAADTIDGDQRDDSAPRAGAVYVFVRADPGWVQQAYVKPIAVDKDDEFGRSLALSADGSTLAVGVPYDGSCSKVINQGPEDDACPRAGAVHVFVRTGESWAQQAYVKAANAAEEKYFGLRVALSGSGDTLAVISDDGPQSDYADGEVFVYGRADGQWQQEGELPGLRFSWGNNRDADVALAGDGETLAVGAAWDDGDYGLVRVYARHGGEWTQQKEILAPASGYLDRFGCSVALAHDGGTLAVGAYREDSPGVGVDGEPDDESLQESGAAYVYVRADGSWPQQAYFKARSPGAKDWFGGEVALSGDGETLAVGAVSESSGAAGIGGDASDDSTPLAGAVFVYTRDGAVWSEHAYVKSPAPHGGDNFGLAIGLADDGLTLAVGAPYQNYDGTGVGEPPSADASFNSGAAYVY